MSKPWDKLRNSSPMGEGKFLTDVDEAEIHVKDVSNHLFRVYIGDEGVDWGQFFGADDCRQMAEFFTACADQLEGK